MIDVKKAMKGAKKGETLVEVLNRQFEAAIAAKAVKSTRKLFRTGQRQLDQQGLEETEE